MRCGICRRFGFQVLALGVSLGWQILYLSYGATCVFFASGLRVVGHGMPSARIFEEQ
jgi:anthranilate/para-aminobenzoate synthase component II